ncbi:hypothetical protein [Methylomonas sp. CM2]|uniref:hypothetical protein n=1 Tax=Methylomonas sp. CM2 TaxID=3417647 RepID=UPI003CF8CC64
MGRGTKQERVFVLLDERDPAVYVQPGNVEVGVDYIKGQPVRRFEPRTISRDALAAWAKSQRLVFEVLDKYQTALRVGAA